MSVLIKAKYGRAEPGPRLGLPRTVSKTHTHTHTVGSPPGPLSSFVRGVWWGGVARSMLIPVGGRRGRAGGGGGGGVDNGRFGALI